MLQLQGPWPSFPACGVLKRPRVLPREPSTKSCNNDRQQLLVFTACQERACCLRMFSFASYNLV